MKNRKVLVAVAWPYVNGDLHIGHLAGYLLPADICARFHRFIGVDVAMVSGSDCFGTPTTIEADKRKMTPKEVVAEYHVKNLALFEIVGISFDLFTKTDTETHIKTAQDVFVKMAEGGFIFTDKTEQYFSKEENRFLPDRYVEGECPNCHFLEARSDQCDKCGTLLNQGELIKPRSKNSGGSVELKETEHYFVNWPKLQLYLEGFVSERGSSWRPWVLEETRGWLKRGLKPRAITRDLDWGVPIPTDRLPDNLKIQEAENKRIYVWFEAVLGYLSATIEWADKQGRDFKDFWYNEEARHYYFMGKDNLVFHALFLPGELYAYDKSIHLPDFPIINQFLNLEGQKFSKSRGITIDSKYIVETYGRDVVRFYLTSIMPENGDANFVWEDFVKSVNGVLVANIGNFVNRTLTLTKNAEMDSSLVNEDVIKTVAEKTGIAYEALMKCEFKKYLEALLSLSSYGNKYLASEEPWKKKDDQAVYNTVLSSALYIVLGVAILMKPLLIDGHERISKQLGVTFDKWPEQSELEEELMSLFSRVSLSEVGPIFSKIDEKVIEEERAKINIKS